MKRIPVVRSRGHAPKIGSSGLEIGPGVSPAAATSVAAEPPTGRVKSSQTAKRVAGLAEVEISTDRATVVVAMNTFIADITEQNLLLLR